METRIDNTKQNELNDEQLEEAAGGESEMKCPKCGGKMKSVFIGFVLMGTKCVKCGYMV